MNHTSPSNVSARSIHAFFSSWLFLTILLASLSISSLQAQPTSEKPAPVYFGDPFILLHEGVYYAYGTAAEDGIAVYQSQDLKTWESPSNRLALKKADVWGEKWFWAPEVHYWKGKFYMFYSAEEHICLATADSPLGPFTQDIKEPMIADEKCIDNSLFVDNGKPYMLYDRFNDGLNIWIAELEPDGLQLIKGTEKPCIHVSQEWETKWPRVNEGAYLLKQDEQYFLVYSANSYESPYYGIGFATAKTLDGPWTKYEKNPILQMPQDLQGVGHSALFYDKEGKLRIVYHSHFNKEKIHPRKMHIASVYFEKENGKTVMCIANDSITPTLMPK